MPKHDKARSPKVKSFSDILLLGAIRNPDDPVKGLVGARCIMEVKK
jgi:hypothetical protein